MRASIPLAVLLACGGPQRQTSVSPWTSAPAVNPPAGPRCDIPVGQSSPISAAPLSWVRVSDAPASVFSQTLDAGDSRVGVQIQKTSSAAYVAHVVRWDGTTFAELGQLPESPNCAGTMASGASVARGPDGRLVAALNECDGIWAASFDGQWRLLGRPLAGVYHVDGLAIDPLGRPALAWSDYDRGQMPLRVNIGAGWDPLGDILASNAAGASIGFTPAGAPIVASFLYPLAGSRYWGAAVHAWNGASWDTLGCRMYTDGPAAAIAADAAGAPVLARTIGGALEVDRWDGQRWQILGSSFPSLGRNETFSLALDLQGRIVLAYSSSFLLQRCAARALRFSGGTWEDFGWSPIQSPNGYGCGPTLSIAADGSPRIYVTGVGDFALQR